MNEAHLQTYYMYSCISIPSPAYSGVYDLQDTIIVVAPFQLFRPTTCCTRGSPSGLRAPGYSSVSSPEIVWIWLLGGSLPAEQLAYKRPEASTRRPPERLLRESCQGSNDSAHTHEHTHTHKRSPGNRERTPITPETTGVYMPRTRSECADDLNSRGMVPYPKQARVRGRGQSFHLPLLHCEHKVYIVIYICMSSILCAGIRTFSEVKFGKIQTFSPPIRLVYSIGKLASLFTAPCLGSGRLFRILRVYTVVRSGYTSSAGSAN